LESIVAFGIDDALTAAAAAISLTDTVVRTVRSYEKSDMPDFEQLIDEVRITARRGIDDADFALVQLERTLHERGVDTGMTLQEVIEATPWWRPFEEYRLKRIRQSFNALADATYVAADDIAALARCRDVTGEMGRAVVASAIAKRELNARLQNAPTLDTAIAVLREELRRQKAALTR